MALAVSGVISTARSARRRLSLVATALALVPLIAAAAWSQIPAPTQPPARPAPAPADTVRRAPVDTARPAPAQPRDTAPRAPAPTAATPDSARAGAPRGRPAAAAPVTPQPPISPTRALIYSMLVPGLGQSRLERPSAGALFVAIEVGVLTMVRKSRLDLNDAKRFRADSVVQSYPIDPVTGQPGPPVLGVGYYNEALIRSRRLHYEDWIALLLFNHIFAGADAFVAANLWDLPTQVTARPLDGGRGTALAVRVAW